MHAIPLSWGTVDRDGVPVRISDDRRSSDRKNLPLPKAAAEYQPTIT